MNKESSKSSQALLNTLGRPRPIRQPNSFKEN